MLAVQRDNLSTVMLLLKYKADFSKRNREEKAFYEFAISEEMKSITSKYEKLLNKLNSDPTQSISPRPLARKRKRHSNKSDSSKNSISESQAPTQIQIFTLLSLYFLKTIKRCPCFRENELETLHYGKQNEGLFCSIIGCKGIYVCVIKWATIAIFRIMQN